MQTSSEGETVLPVRWRESHLFRNSLKTEKGLVYVIVFYRTLRGPVHASEGRGFGWQLRNVRKIKPVRARGRLGLWKWRN
jgi:hypothetical protein